MFMMTDVAMLYRGEAPHPAHRGFAEAIDADLLSLERYPLSALGLSQSIPEEVLNGAVLPHYDTYVAEGTRALYGAIAAKIPRSSTLIYLAGDASLYQLRIRDSAEQPLANRIISEYAMDLMSALFDRYIDGVIAVSEFVAGHARRSIQSPIRVAHPYIESSLYDRLAQFNPNLDDKTAVTIGSYAWYKGQDILPEVWSEVRERHPDAELQLVGSGYPEYLDETPGVTVCGYVDDLPKKLAGASLYLHPARADAFAVTVLEALRAGLPTVVTSTTGSRSVVRELDESMVVDRDSTALANEVCRYFSRETSERQKLSQMARELGSTFDSESRRDAFRREYIELIAEIDSRLLP